MRILGPVHLWVVSFLNSWSLSFQEKNWCKACLLCFDLYSQNKVGKSFLENESFMCVYKSPFPPHDYKSKFVNLYIYRFPCFSSREHFRAILKNQFTWNREYHRFFWCIAIRQGHLIFKRQCRHLPSYQNRYI